MEKRKFVLDMWEGRDASVESLVLVDVCSASSGARGKITQGSQLELLRVEDAGAASNGLARDWSSEKPKNPPKQGERIFALLCFRHCRELFS